MLTWKELCFVFLRQSFYTAQSDHGLTTSSCSFIRKLPIFKHALCSRKLSMSKLPWMYIPDADVATAFCHTCPLLLFWASKISYALSSKTTSSLCHLL